MGRVDKLREAVKEGKKIAIFMHYFPDPDCVASAYALKRVLLELGKDEESIEIFYRGRFESGAAYLMNLLNVGGEIKEYGGEFDEESYDTVIYVDRNYDEVYPRPNIIIDHHTLRGAKNDKLKYADVAEVGSSSSILSLYLMELGVSLEDEEGKKLSTLLLYGIISDTNKFSRNVTQVDMNAVQYLEQFADKETIKKCEEYEDEFYRKFVEVAEENIDRGERFLVSSLGEIEDKSVIGKTADSLLKKNNVDVAVVYAFIDDVLFYSIRSGKNVDLYRVSEEVFKSCFGADAEGSYGGREGAAGGHVKMGERKDMKKNIVEVLRKIDL